MTKEAYYFSHDSNARQDPKILEMMSVYGAEGYGWYWILVEMMREQSDYTLNMQGKYTYNALAMQMHCTSDACKQFVDDCINEFGLFDSDGKYFWSNSLLRRMALREEISQKRKKAAEARWKKADKPTDSPKNDASGMQMHNKSNANGMQGKERKVKDIYTPEFEEFWKVYPRKIEKKQAATKFRAKIKQYDLPTIVEGTKAYVQFLEENQTDKKYIKHAATFLNNDSFLEYSGSSEEPKENDPQEEIRERKRELEMSIELGEEYWRKFETIEEYESMKKELEELEQL